MEQAVDLARVLHQSGAKVNEAVSMLSEPTGYHQQVVELDRLEEEGDRIARAALVIVRWKDIFECLEQAIDACDRVGNLLQGIALQQG